MPDQSIYPLINAVTLSSIPLSWASSSQSSGIRCKMDVRRAAASRLQVGTNDGEDAGDVSWCLWSSYTCRPEWSSISLQSTLLAQSVLPLIYLKHLETLVAGNKHAHWFLWSRKSCPISRSLPRVHPVVVAYKSKLEHSDHSEHVSITIQKISKNDYWLPNIHL